MTMICATEDSILLTELVNQSGVMLFSVGDHDIPCISIPRHFHCISHSPYFEPLCWSVQHLSKQFFAAAFSFDHSSWSRCSSFFSQHGQKRLSGVYIHIYIHMYMYYLWVIFLHWLLLTLLCFIYLQSMLIAFCVKTTFLRPQVFFL